MVLYTQQAFADITRAPGWVGALNDGRIRVPVQGLSELDAGFVAGFEARADAQFCAAENAQPRADLDARRDWRSGWKGSGAG